MGESYVQLPDNSYLHVPDGVPDEDVRGAIMKQFPSVAVASRPGYKNDAIDNFDQLVSHAPTPNPLTSVASRLVKSPQARAIGTAVGNVAGGMARDTGETLWNASSPGLATNLITGNKQALQRTPGDAIMTLGMADSIPGSAARPFINSGTAAAEGEAATAPSSVSRLQKVGNVAGQVMDHPLSEMLPRPLRMAGKILKRFRSGETPGATAEAPSSGVRSEPMPHPGFEKRGWEPHPDWLEEQRNRLSSLGGPLRDIPEPQVNTQGPEPHPHVSTENSIKAEEVPASNPEGPTKTSKLQKKGNSAAPPGQDQPIQETNNTAAKPRTKRIRLDKSFELPSIDDSAHFGSEQASAQRAYDKLDTAMKKGSKLVKHRGDIDPNELLSTSGEIGGAHDMKLAEKYARQRAAGSEPPPITVMVDENGNKLINDGHHRSVAAGMLRKKVPAIVQRADMPYGMEDSLEDQGIKQDIERRLRNRHSTPWGSIATHD